MTSFPWQSLLAPVIVLLAIAYLWWAAKAKGRHGGIGCASGGSCGCSKPALPPHLKHRTPLRD